jgi:putative transposase
MEVRLAIGAEALLAGDGESVTDVCRRLGISRDSYYRYRRRMLQEGVEGLLPHSRRPRSSPAATDAQTMGLIVAKHDELVGEGWDGGARSVHDWLTLAGVSVPSARTCHKILAAHGRTTSTPTKRPKSSYRHFEAMAPNGMWQLDGHNVGLADGSKAVVLRFQDDHSRAVMASRAAPAETGEQAWKCLQTAMNRHGKPAVVLCDNAAAFTTRLIRGGGYADFEARLHRIGVAMTNSRPGHPQTCGKKEREWQTLDRWLAARAPARDLSELQRLLDAYDLIFNTRRPHQAIGGGTPAQRYAATVKAVPDPDKLKPRQFLHTITVSADGHLDLPGARVRFSRPWGGVQLNYLIDLDQAILFHGDHILARVHLNRHIGDQRPKPTYYRIFHTRP